MKPSIANPVIVVALLALASCSGPGGDGAESDDVATNSDAGHDSSSAIDTADSPDSDSTDDTSDPLCCLDATEIATTGGGVTSFVVENGTVYFSGSDSLKRLAEDGGDPVLVAEGKSFRNLVFDGDHFFFVHRNFNGVSEITRLPSDGSSSVTVREVDRGSGEFATSVCDLEIDDGHVYWSEDDGDIFRVRKEANDGTGDFLAFSSGCPTIEVSDNYVYFAGDFTVGRVDKRGEGKTELHEFSESSGTSRGLAKAGDQLFWLRTNVDGRGVVQRLPTVGGEPTDLASGQENAFSLAVDDSYVYWTTYENGEVRRVPVEGGTIEDVHLTSEYVPFLELEGRYVYWSQNGDQARIMKRAKEFDGE